MSRKLCLVLFLPDPLPYLPTVVGVVVGPLRALEAMRIAQKLGNGPVLTPQHPVLIIGVQDFANLCLLPWDCFTWLLMRGWRAGPWREGEKVLLCGTSLVVRWLRLHTSNAGGLSLTLSGELRSWVWSPVGELRSHRLPAVQQKKKKKFKRKYWCAAINGHLWGAW